MPNRFLLTSLQGIFRAVKRFDKRRAEFNASEARNILIVNTTAMGDTLLSTPAIRAIREGFPDAHITALVSSAAKSILLNNPHVDSFIDHPGKINFFYIFKLPRLLRRIRNANFDLVAILHANDPDIVPLAYLSGALHRLGWAESKLAFLHTMPVKTKIPNMHGIDIHLKNLEALGIKITYRKMELYLSREERDWADSFILRSGIKDKKLIGIHSFGNKVNKWWPLEHVVEFCKRIMDELDLQIIVFGGNKEANFAEEISQKAGNVINAAGRINVRESASLIEKCAAFISTDSGPMHIAQALGVPTIALFGPDDPAITGPVSEPYEVIQKRLPCVPCRLTVCDKDRECMKEITADNVIEAVKRLLVRFKGVNVV